MKVITEENMICIVCDWTGTVDECEPDIDGDGNLVCPRCNGIAKIDKTLQEN